MNPGHSSQKQYGLIKSTPKSQPSALKPSVFNNDSSSDDEAPKESWGKTALKAAQHGSVQAAQTRQVIRKAMQEDPSLFQYDEVYEDIQQNRSQATSKQNEAKKPRYMQQLLASAEQRRHQHERRVERQVQREREEEGDEFADKEAFVTAAYRQRLLEREKEEEQERRTKRIEELTDVTKMKDLGSFYRHMYHQRSSPSGGADASGGADVDPAAVKAEPVDTDPAAAEAVRPSPQEPARVKKEPTSPSPDAARSTATSKLSDGARNRQYRRRRSSSVSSPERSDPESERRGRKRRSGSSRKSSETAEGRAPVKDKRRHGRDREASGDAKPTADDKTRGSDSEGLSDDSEPVRPRDDPAPSVERARGNSDGGAAAAAEVRPPRATSEERAQRRRALYSKRTVGAVLEAARERYRLRLQAREAALTALPAA